MIFRTMTAVETTHYIRDIFLNEPDIYKWDQMLRSIDAPKLEVGMCGVLGTAMSLLLTQEKLLEVADILLRNVAG